MPTITIEIEHIPRGGQSDDLAAELRSLVAPLNNATAEIKTEHFEAWMRLHAELGSPNPGQIARFAEQMQLLANQTGTPLALTISEPPAHSNLSALLGVWANFATDGHRFQIHPNGDSGYLHAFLCALLSRGAL